MKIIKVGKKKFDCHVDDDLYEWLIELSPWQVIRSQNLSYYAHSYVYGLMHRIIYTKIYGSIESEFVIDHKDRDSLNNTIANLRKATRSQNLSNSPKPFFGKTTSRFKGVSWNSRDQRWQARISLNNATVNLGNYKDEIEAAKAYNEAVLELRDGFGYLNNINEDELKNVINESEVTT